MHENAPMLKAQKRDRLGTRYTTRVREAGGLPAIVYGRGKEPVPVTLESREATRYIKKGEKVFRLDFPGTANKDEGQMVLLKDIQFDHLGTHIVHADFSRVSLTDRVVVKVPIHLIGEAKGLKTAGAILMHPVSELDVECAVKDIPEFVEVQIGELDVDHAITAADVKLPVADMKLKTDKHAKVAQIVIQQEIVEVKAEAGAVEGGPAEPEVLTARKPKEGEEAAAGAKPAAGAKAPAAGAAKPAAGAKPAAAPAKDAKK